MYFVNRIRHEFAADEDGFFPNEKFKQHLNSL